MTASATTDDICAASGVPGEAPPLELLKGASLFLDFDGTLVDIQSEPDAVSVDARLQALIAKLADRLDGRVAIVSGRSIAQLDAIFGGLSIATSGSHGAERRGVGGVAGAPERPASLEAVTRAMRGFADANPGVLVEVKSFGVGLHYRGAAHAEGAARALAARLANDAGLSLQEGKMVFEVRVPGDKGQAIAGFLDEAPFAAGRPIFLGDDLTDEAGFAAARERGGAGILIGEPRASAASYRIGGVAAALDWLDRAAGAA